MHFLRIGLLDCINSNNIVIVRCTLSTKYIMMIIYVEMWVVATLCACRVLLYIVTGADVELVPSWRHVSLHCTALNRKSPFKMSDVCDHIQ